MRIPLILLLAGLAANAVAQSFSLDWFTIDGGGGTSTNGIYSVTGTIGQPDAGVPMTNGNYSLTGGFWAYIAIQTEDAPYLSITRTATNTLAISWTSDSADWLLQQNTALASTNWVPIAEGITENGATKTFIVTPPAGNRFYRLIRP